LSYRHLVGDLTSLLSAERAHLGGDRFRLWDGLSAHDRFGDIWMGG
jgi:hypothetical protein